MTVMTGREALMQVLNHEGVDFVFGLPGSTELMFMDALVDHPEIKFILGLHEVIALGMAEAILACRERWAWSTCIPMPDWQRLRRCSSMPSWGVSLW